MIRSLQTSRFRKGNLKVRIMSDNIKSRKKRKKSDGSVSSDAYIVWTLSIGKSPTFPALEPEKNP